MPTSQVTSSFCALALALELERERAHRVDAGARERLRAPAQHVDQARLVERRISIGRTGEAGDAAGDGGVHFRLQSGLVLLARLAQPRRQVDESRGDDQAFRLYHPVCFFAFPFGDFSVDNPYVADGVAPACRIDYATAFYLQAHLLLCPFLNSPRRCS